MVVGQQENKSKNMEITLEQLESLLSQQKSLCRFEFEKEWEKSEILKDIKTIDIEGKIYNKIHWVRDAILRADVPDDVKVLKKYKILK